MIKIKFRCAGIVLYNPDINRLKENINSIYKQVDKLILVDNNSYNLNEVKSEYENNSKINIIENDSNKGIAYALNQLVNAANDIGYDWMLLLDQDSVCCNNIMDIYREHLHEGKVALIAPYIIDINKMTLSEYKEMELEETSKLIWAITSGSLVRIDILLNLGGFDEYLFIDEVDIEYSKRLQINGYIQLRANRAYLLQEVGNADVLRVKRPHKDMAGTITWKPLYRTNHSAMRRYYMARNGIIVAKKYRNYQSYYLNVFKIIGMNLIRVSIENNKKILLKQVMNGLYDGFKYKVNPYSKKEENK